MNAHMKKHTDRGAYVDSTNRFALVNTDRNWWAIIPVVENVIQYGDTQTEYVNGTYKQVVNYLHTLI
jgi:hypothetical protein